MKSKNTLILLFTTIAILSSASLILCDVTKIESDEDFTKLIEKSKAQSSVLIIKWGAEWCPSCASIQPVFESLAQKDKGKKYCDIDVEKLKKSADKFGIQAIPATTVFIGGKKIKSIIGYKPENELGKLIQNSLKPKDQKTTTRPTNCRSLWQKIKNLWS